MKRLGARSGFKGVVAIALVAMAAVAAVPSSAEAQAGKKLKRLGVDFPMRIGGSKRLEHTNFEKRAPGLGHGVKYEAPGWTINLFVYDKQKKSIPDGVESPAVTVEFEQAKGDIFTAEKKGVYTDVTLNREYLLTDLAGSHRFQCAGFGFVHKTRGDVDSFLCVTSRLGKFIKLRATADRRDGSDLAFRQYMGAWIEHLWPGR